MAADPDGEERELQTHGGRIEFDSWRLNLWAVPASLGFVFLCKLLWVPDLVFWYVFSIPTHEMGHAIAAWLSGRFAVPIGAILPAAAFTAIAAKRSVAVFCASAGTSAIIGYRSFRARRPYPVFVSILILALSIHFTWILPERETLMWFTYAGAGGELILGTFLVVSFYYRLPDRWRWDFFRLIALVAGMYAFLSAFLLWLKVSQGAADMPMGSLLNGRGDEAGDMERLVSLYGWTKAGLVSSYVRLGWICSAVIGAHYLFFLRRAYLKTRRIRHS